MANSGPGPHGNPPPGAPPPAHPPGYGPPGAASAAHPQGSGPAGPPPTPKKPNVALFVALGCGALLVFGGIAAAVGAYVFTRSAKRVVEQLPEIASGLTLPPPAPPATIVPGLPADPGVIPGVPAGGAPAVSVPQTAPPAATPTPGSARTAAPAATSATPAVSASPTASAPAAPSATCIKAAACCRTLVNRSPGGVSALAGNCENLRTLTDSVCASSLETYRQAARMIGASCD